jgi:hypothetical protein
MNNKNNSKDRPFQRRSKGETLRTSCNALAPSYKIIDGSIFAVSHLPFLTVYKLINLLLFELGLAKAIDAGEDGDEQMLNLLQIQTKILSQRRFTDRDNFL